MGHFEDHFGLTIDTIRGVDVTQVSGLCDLLLAACRADRQIFIFGNGGSGATASHFCQDLAKGTLKSPEQKTRLRVLALTDNTPAILAWANDHGYDHVFEQQLRNLGRQGDVAIGISGSGNSANVLKAIDYAASIGMETVGMTGYDGGELRNKAKHSVHVALANMEVVESVQMTICHAVVTYLRGRLDSRGGS